MKYEAPCGKDCKDRKGGCHATCEKYIEYDKKRLERSKKKVEAVEREMEIVQVRKDSIRRNYKRNGK